MKRLISLLCVTIVYVAAFFLGLRIYMILPYDDEPLHMIIKLFISDVAATVMIFLIGWIFKNPSFYDPYWSIAPLIMGTYFYVKNGHNNVFGLIALILIFIWGIRLTINWIIHFNDLNYVDWRYKMLKEKHPKLFPLINLFGIHLVPTIVVFIALVPAFDFMVVVGTENYVPTIMTVAAYLITLLAIVIETLSDIQMMKFKKNPVNKGKIMSVGLWKNSRHPNYFGECLFWAGLFLCSLSFEASFTGTEILLIVCPVIMFGLFFGISIPMMDKRQLANKPNYAEYKKRTNAMLPIFPPKVK